MGGSAILRKNASPISGLPYRFFQALNIEWRIMAVVAVEKQSGNSADFSWPPLGL
jgi:hypothetical protein